MGGIIGIQLRGEGAASHEVFTCACSLIIDWCSHLVLAIWNEHGAAYGDWESEAI